MNHNSHTISEIQRELLLLRLNKWLLTSSRYVGTIVFAFAFANSTDAKTVPPAFVVPQGQITQWTATDDFVCTLYVDGTIVCWDLKSGHSVGRQHLPQTAGNLIQCEIATDQSGNRLGYAYSATTFAPSVLLILSLPEFARIDAYNLHDRLDGNTETIAQLSCTEGRISYDGVGHYITGAFDFKKNRELWQFKNPTTQPQRPMAFPSPVFAMPDFAGYISVMAGKATARNVQGKILWTTALPQPTDYWTSPDRIRSFSRVFVVEDRDDSVSRLSAFDSASGKPVWQSSVAASGDILVTNEAGDAQVFLKGDKYVLRHLPNDDHVSLQLSGDFDLRFTPDSRYLLALPRVETKPSGAGMFSRSRRSSSLSVLDTETGKMVRIIPLDQPRTP